LKERDSEKIKLREEGENPRKRGAFKRGIFRSGLTN